MSKHTAQSAGTSAGQPAAGCRHSTFALFFGNRRFFPASLQETARQEMAATLKKLGYGTLLLEADATRHGAVETPKGGHLHPLPGKAPGGVRRGGPLPAELW